LGVRVEIPLPSHPNSLLSPPQPYLLIRGKIFNNNTIVEKGLMLNKYGE
jgi:hypothetical protein